MFPNSNITVSACMAITTFPFFERDLNLTIILPGAEKNLANTLWIARINVRVRRLLFRGCFFRGPSSREENNRVLDELFVFNCPCCLRCVVNDELRLPFLATDPKADVFAWNPWSRVGRFNRHSKITDKVFILENVNDILPSQSELVSQRNLGESKHSDVTWTSNWNRNCVPE